jgi:hypothetical protein
VIVRLLGRRSAADKRTATAGQNAHPKVTARSRKRSVASFPPRCFLATELQIVSHFRGRITNVRTGPLSGALLILAKVDSLIAPEMSPCRRLWARDARTGSSYASPPDGAPVLRAKRRCFAPTRTADCSWAVRVQFSHRSFASCARSILSKIEKPTQFREGIGCGKADAGENRQDQGEETALSHADTSNGTLPGCKSCSAIAITFRK